MNQENKLVKLLEKRRLKRIWNFDHHKARWAKKNAMMTVIID
jgi:hypothetical protein